jgi:hypothetical protein
MQASISQNSYIKFFLIQAVQRKNIGAWMSENDERFGATECRESANPRVFL